MREEKVSVLSDGLRLSGIIHLPDNTGSVRGQPAFVVLHGFGSTKESDNASVPCRFLSRLGYVALRIDMRGCGESDGERGRVICMEQVEDTKNAVSYLASREEVDANRIGCFGSSFGGAVAIYTGGVDLRVAAVISSGGWGDGEAKFKGQHPGDAWAAFCEMLEQGLEIKKQTGHSIKIPRDKIVPIPSQLKTNLKSNAIAEFPIETVESMYNFKANDVIAHISPRPVLLLHSSNDSVTPTDQSIELFRRSKQPTDLHLFANVDHFMFAEENRLVRSTIENWLNVYLPVHVAHDNSRAAS
ncbi:MAG: alpha/beta hydrolase [Pseudorhodoplanes sp.]|uniref:alpha/beta hydrolase n=1 Tax=Pseudorhodoplanes sp. TaxID=1934341 RepID=UPI003D0E9A75